MYDRYFIGGWMGGLSNNEGGGEVCVCGRGGGGVFIHFMIIYIYIYMAILIKSYFT